ncbi:MULTISPECIES: GTPase ObgE [Hymenobacter]|uniref:GTPase Obg n=1 Tax=Hymenobacter jejuensis TaxID=2502781 RepID=A0A5B7ZWU4_9BACT|nr:MULTISPECIES: GTPase ObgE [Hymenobacter]MBC6988315.1 GTPase ObgE [Hymenobacter sp. BT491]QDA59327.1 GTPase ObgE [Hymenobacter jejuensis]
MASNNFIDYVKINCRSGRGGAGSHHFFRAKGLPNGGPDGGDGGRGGHIILEGNSQLWTLLHLQYRKHIIAGHGEGGGENLRSGAQGEDIVVPVPLGTIARDAETGEKKVEITEHGQRVILTPGGRGGLGNDHFKSATNQAPTYAQPGEPGIDEWIILELKLLADVGLVGFPNAGKSTLLSVVSAARPKIADYAFTTLVPNLGVVAYRDYQSFVMADIPGIIEGAAEGRGLGTRFLKHIERNSILLFMISCDSDDIAAEYGILLSELEQFNPELLEKRRLLAISKADLIDDELEAEIRETLPKDLPTVFISSLANKNLQQLKDMIWQELHAKE